MSEKIDSSKKPEKKSEKKKAKASTKPQYSKMALSTRRIIISSIALLILVGAYVGLFFVPKFPGYLWLRLSLAAGFALLMGTAIFFLIKKRLTAKDIEYILDEENFARAVKALKLSKFYTKKLPGFPYGIRKEVFPAAICTFVLFLALCIVSPCKPPEAPLPDFAQMAAQELYYPHLYAGSDSVLILAPPQLSRESEIWAAKIPPKYLEWTMYAEMFQNHFENAYASGNLSDLQTSGVLLAMAQASMFAGQYEQALQEYEAVLAAPKGAKGPEIAFQRAIAMAYAGKLKDAESAMEALDPKAVRDALDDDFALPHWKLVLKLLQGDFCEEVVNAYQTRYKKQSNALAKMNESVPAVSAETESTASPTDKKISAAEIETQNKRTLQERRVASTANNMAIVQLLNGEYSNAIQTANSVILLAHGKAARSAKIMRMNALNTKGLAVGILGTSTDDKAGEWDASAVFESQAGYFAEARKLYEEVLAMSRLETDAVSTAFQKEPFSLLPWCSEIRFALQNQFTSKEFPEEKVFLEKYVEPLRLCAGLHKVWCANEVSRVPVYAVPIENLLMRTSLILEGVDSDDYYQLALGVCTENFKKDVSLPLLATRTNEMELNLLGRFAAKEALAIGMTEKLQNEQKKNAKSSKAGLPPTHPLLVRQSLTAFRLTLMQKSLAQKDFGDAKASLDRAGEILTGYNFPKTCWLTQELEEAQSLTAALKKKDASEIRAVFQPLLDQNVNNLFHQAWIYRNLGFALQHRDFSTEADAANRSARTIFNQQIFRSNPKHFLLLQVDKILKH